MEFKYSPVSREVAVPGRAPLGEHPSYECRECAFAARIDLEESGELPTARCERVELVKEYSEELEAVGAAIEGLPWLKVTDRARKRAPFARGEVGEVSEDECYEFILSEADAERRIPRDSRRHRSLRIAVNRSEILRRLAS